MNRLENKVAVITGACSGIGAATARRFAAEGAQLVLADVSDSHCDEVIASCGGGTNDRSNVEFVLTDVSKEADVIAMIDAAIARFGRLDILFNNAGIGSFCTTSDAGDGRLGQDFSGRSEFSVLWLQSRDPTSNRGW